MATERLLNNSEIEKLRHQAQSLPSPMSRGNSQLIGPLDSPYRGSGMELEELRAYQAGDDVRHIAWRASARSNRPLSKVFRAERQQRVLFMVEQHPGMGFASRGELKATIASRAAALLSFAALKQGAEVGGVIIDSQRHFFNCSNRLEPTLAMIGQINRSPGQHSPIDSADSLIQLSRLLQRDDRIYLISDFNDWNDTLRNPLAQLAENNRVEALQILDRGEQQLVDVGRLRIRSPFDGSEQIIDTTNAKLRQRYAEVMTTRQRALEELLRSCAIPHRQLHTDGDTFQELVAQ